MDSYKQYSNAQCAFFDGMTQLSKQIKTLFSISFSKIYTAYTKYWMLYLYNKSENVHILIICIKNYNKYAAAQTDYQNLTKKAFIKAKPSKQVFQPNTW